MSNCVLSETLHFCYQNLLLYRKRAVYCVLMQNEVTGGDAGIISPSNSSTVPDSMPLVPTARSWEVSQDKANIVKVIGKGAFGQVAKTTVENLHNMNGLQLLPSRC